MAPAIECAGCGYKAKTADEPASPEQMQALMDAYGTHGALNYGCVIAAIANPSMTEGHDVNMIFHPQTPTKGFEDAVVVELSTKGLFHSQ